MRNEITCMYQKSPKSCLCTPFHSAHFFSDVELPYQIIEGERSRPTLKRGLRRSAHSQFIYTIVEALRVVALGVSKKARSGIFLRIDPERIFKRSALGFSVYAFIAYHSLYLVFPPQLYSVLYTYIFDISFI